MSSSDNSGHPAIGLGHYRIGHLRGPDVKVAADRYEGYRQTLANHKIRFNELLVHDCGFFENQGYESMRAWIARGDIPTAIFAANDPAAIGAMDALEEAGIKVPAEVAVVGAGNIHFADHMRVPLTTVAWDKTELGQRAARLLIKMIEQGDSADNTARSIVEPQLVVRKSCGADRRAFAGRTGMFSKEQPIPGAEISDPQM